LEMFLDGVVILDLPGLHQYRSGQAVLDQHFAKCETNGMGDIVELLRAIARVFENGKIDGRLKTQT